MKIRRIWIAIAAMAIALTTVPSAQQAAQSPSPAGRRFALLVGVTEFIAPAMKKHNLQGPANDVALFRTLLEREGFQVPAADITSLAGLPDAEAARPTRSNIERAFRALRDTAGPGDHVVVLLAGHGSQQPANPDPADEEPDGLDEIFLPADATGWDRSSSRVANAIVDDDIRQWVGAIRNKGASVWLIVDACHSGTMTRAGGSNARERGIPVDTLIPASALAAARGNVKPAVIEGPAPRPFELTNSAADIAALYAADMTEGTPELPMPDRNGPVHGLFTYTLTRVLTEHVEPLTYRELVQRVIDRYRAEGFGPTPAFEGAGVDREVMGERATRDRLTFAIEARPREGRWTLAAGSVHGLTPGSVLEVLPPNSSAATATPVGHVRVVDVHPTAAVVTPIAFAKLPAPSAARVTAGSRARIKHHEFGALRLRVALQRAVEASGRAAETFEVIPSRRGPPALVRALDSLQTLTNGLADTVNSSDADWFVRVTDNRVILTPARDSLSVTARNGVTPQGPSKRFDVGAVDDDDLQYQLADRLRRIARAANLARLSSYVDPEASQQVHVLRRRSDEITPRPLLADSGDPIVNVGEHLQFVVKNTGTVPLDFTVVYVDANFGITALFPPKDSQIDNRLDPGQERALEPEEIGADPLGWESVVAIGVESTLRHENFRWLEQEKLDDVRGASDAPRSPLGVLLESAVYGTRGASVDAGADRGRFAITQTWFRVVEQPGK